MPTFTTIALETLLEPRLTDSYKNSKNSNQHTPKFPHVNDQKNRNPNPPTSKHIYISPALYTTPEPTPVASSSVESLSPSPYVFNRKGRGGKGLRHRIDAIESEKKKKRSDGKLNGGQIENVGGLGGEIKVYDEFLGAEVVRDRDEEAVLDEDLLDTRFETSSVVTFNQGEFFDADEEFFSDGSVSIVPSSAQSIESVLCATRLSLFEEIKKRKSSEEALDLMYNQWQRVADVLSKAGVKPTPSNASSSIQLDVNSIEQFVEEIVMARFVAEAIGKGQARAEAEIAAEEIVKSKDHEISRLRDRLQYYEAVNHGMSQRNQEVMELARRQRHRKKGLQQRWLWGFIGLSITIGASVIAYSCLPQTGEHHIILQASTDSTDASCICSSESA
ncbi:hypothetical protein LguiB_021662 [Lonicera macranthoides]